MCSVAGNISTGCTRSTAYPLGNIFVPLTDPLGAYKDYRPMTAADLPASASVAVEDGQVTGESLLSCTAELCRDSETPEPADIPFIRSDDLSEILQASEYVLLVTVGEERPGMSGIYYCSVEKVLRGECSVPDEITIPFISDDIESGQSYYALLNRAGEESDWFAESSPHSLFDADDARAVAELLAAVGRE